jgi:hypothetical protein
MSKLHVKVGKPWSLSSAGLAEMEELHNGTFMGAWAIKRDNGVWTESPVDIFYVKEPDTEAGHSNYFGIFFRGDDAYICNGATAFSEPMAGMVDGDEVKVSRYRHDCVWNSDQTASIDGGRDYTKCTGGIDFRTVIVEGDQFIVTGAG